MEEFFTAFKNTFSFLGLVISFLTLLLAYYIKIGLGKSHIRTKQIDHVCEVIKILNESKIEVMFSTLSPSGGLASSGVALQLNIFEIANYDQIDSGENKNHEDEIVLFDSNSNQIMDIKKFIDHPLTPRSIADELLKFHTSYCEYFDTRINRDRDTFDFVEIRTSIFDPMIMRSIDKSLLIKSSTSCMKTWLDFKESAKNLKLAIGTWLIDNGIKENNIRVDFKTIS